MVKYKDGRFLEGEFDLSIPNRGAHGYWRILHPYTRGVTSSEGIIQDVDLFLNLYKLCGNLRESKLTVFGTGKGRVRRSHAKRQEAGKY